MRGSRSPATVIATIVASVVGVGVAAGPAQAAPDAVAEAFISGASFEGGDGQANRVVVTIAPRSPINGFPAWQVRFDDVFPITPGESCSRPGADATVAVCDVYSDPVTAVVGASVLGGDGADTITFDYPAQFAASARGGTGDDTVIAPTGAIGRIYGDAGNDVLTGTFVWGGDGNDRITASDTGYGEAGQDALTGVDGRQELRGGPGADTLLGGDGDDVLFGNSGADDVRGGRGDDYLSGGPDDDVLFGNSGDDTLLGGSGRDFLSGGTGLNLLYP